MTSLYNETDIQLTTENIDNIVKEADEMRFKYVEPTKDKMWDIIYTVRDFLIEKQRKIYGGFALNKLIESVAPEDKFYDDANIDNWDIDFYSPEPLSDAREIANRLYKKKYRFVRVVEALHDETYKIFAETLNCADISYIPKNIYGRMPFTIYQKLCLTGPHFMMIDYFRILTDPLISYFRLEKSFVRLYLLQKHFPLPKVKKLVTKKPLIDMTAAFDIIREFATDRSTCIITGLYQYNCYVKEVKAIDKQVQFANIDHFDIISTCYTKDAQDLIKLLQQTFNVTKNRITYKEFYPFFQYIGYSVSIMLDENIVCNIYHNNSRCVPYVEVPSVHFYENSYEEKSKHVYIGSFSLLILHCLIGIAKARANRNKQEQHMFYGIITNATKLRKKYLNATKKTILDETPFQDFVLRCTGETNTPIMEKSIRSDRKKRAGKRYSYTYEPENDMNKNDSSYIFKNSSGNEISNPKNAKIHFNQKVTECISGDEIEDI